MRIHFVGVAPLGIDSTKLAQDERPQAALYRFQNPSDSFPVAQRHSGFLLMLQQRSRSRSRGSVVQSFHPTACRLLETYRMCILY